MRVFRVRTFDRVPEEATLRRDPADVVIIIIIAAGVGGAGTAFPDRVGSFVKVALPAERAGGAAAAATTTAAPAAATRGLCDRARAVDGALRGESAAAAGAAASYARTSICVYLRRYTASLSSPLAATAPASRTQLAACRERVHYDVRLHELDLVVRIALTPTRAAGPGAQYPAAGIAVMSAATAAARGVGGGRVVGCLDTGSSSSSSSSSGAPTTNPPIPNPICPCNPVSDLVFLRPPTALGAPTPPRVATRVAVIAPACIRVPPGTPAAPRVPAGEAPVLHADGVGFALLVDEVDAVDGKATDTGHATASGYHDVWEYRGCCGGGAAASARCVTLRRAVRPAACVAAPPRGVPLWGTEAARWTENPAAYPPWDAEGRGWRVVLQGAPPTSPDVEPAAVAKAAWLAHRRMATRNPHEELLTASQYGDAVGAAYTRVAAFVRAATVNQKDAVLAFKGNAATRHGQAMEPFARDLYASALGCAVRDGGFWVPAQQEYWSLGVSPDGLVDVEGDGPQLHPRRLLEIKCPYGGFWNGARYPPGCKGIPPGYVCQMQGQLAVVGARTCDFMVLHDGVFAVWRVRFSPAFWGGRLLPRLLWASFWLSGWRPFHTPSDFAWHPPLDFTVVDIIPLLPPTHVGSGAVASDHPVYPVFAATHACARAAAAAAAAVLSAAAAARGRAAVWYDAPFRAVWWVAAWVADALRGRMLRGVGKRGRAALEKGAEGDIAGGRCPPAKRPRVGRGGGPARAAQTQRGAPGS